MSLSITPVPHLMHVIVIVIIIFVFFFVSVRVVLDVVAGHHATARFTV